MTRPLALPARQVTALCKGAAKAGYIPVVRIGKTIIQLVPEDHAILSQDSDKLDWPEDVKI